MSPARLWLAVAALSLGCASGWDAQGATIWVLAPIAVYGMVRRRSLLRPMGEFGVMFVLGVIAAATTPFGSSPYDRPIGAPAIAVRHGLESATLAASGRTGPLLRGLVAGDTDDIDGPTMEAFRDAGLAHIVAVSGTNVALVAGTVLWLARRLGRRARVLVAGSAVVAFVMVVGPQPTVLRAAAMGIVTLLAFAAGLRTDPLKALALALIAVLAARPDMVGAVGLHLSAAATAGIVLWSPAIARRLTRMPRAVALPLAVTLAAQAAVTPLLVATFGRLSLTAPLANLIALPALLPATVGGLAAALVALASDTWGRVLARAAAPFAAWVLWVADRLGSPEWAAIDVPSSWGGPLGVIAVVGAAAALRHRYRDGPVIVGPSWGSSTSGSWPPRSASAPPPGPSSA